MCTRSGSDLTMQNDTCSLAECSGENVVTARWYKSMPVTHSEEMEDVWLMQDRSRIFPRCIQVLVVKQTTFLAGLVLELQRVGNLMTCVAVGFLLINLTTLTDAQHHMVPILCRLIVYKL